MVSDENIVAWQSPSNIALVKYWGKYGIQLPSNPSISVTLRNAVTQTQVKYTKITGNEFYDVHLLFEGKRNDAFLPKIHQFFDRIITDYPFLRQYRLEIESSNTFPHSAGIASSASSMSALALCVVSVSNKLSHTCFEGKDFFKEASRLARLGSGSACRSLFGGMSIWGNTDADITSSQEYGISFDEFHPTFKNLHDAILIVSGEEKSVSSTVGHGLMNNNPYAEPRFQQASNRLLEIKQFLKKGDWDGFGVLLEEEALTLHALMMTSSPSFMLLKPETLAIIEEIRSFRQETKLPVYFTIDAGPNIHLLYPDDVSEKIKASLIEERLLKYCDKETVIYDQMGEGPVQL